jgi:hypothetical protein
MRKMKIFFGYFLACLSILVALATFFGLPFFSRALAVGTGITVSPWFTGGEVVRTVDHATYRTRIHRPVFDALIGEKRRGFVQVDWIRGPQGNLPTAIAEEIDFDGDSRADFSIDLQTDSLRAVLTPLQSRVQGLDGVCRLDNGIAVRVSLLNEKK